MTVQNEGGYHECCDLQMIPIFEIYIRILFVNNIFNKAEQTTLNVSFMWKNILCKKKKSPTQYLKYYNNVFTAGKVFQGRDFVIGVINVSQERERTVLGIVFRFLCSVSVSNLEMWKEGMMLEY